MDQAFVKAFARRNRGAQNQHVPAEPVEQPEQAETNTEPGSLQVDHSVASTAEVWVDPIEDQIARADQASMQVPTPHVGSRNSRRPSGMAHGFVTEDREGSAVSPQPVAPEKPDTGFAEVAGTHPLPRVPEESGEPQETDHVVESTSSDAARAPEPEIAPSVDSETPVGNAEFRDPLAHIHTAYAGNFADLNALAAAASIQDSMSDAAPVAEPSFAEPTVAEPTVAEPSVAEPNHEYGERSASPHEPCAEPENNSGSITPPGTAEPIEDVAPLREDEDAGEAMTYQLPEIGQPATETHRHDDEPIVEMRIDPAEMYASDTPDELFSENASREADHETIVDEPTVIDDAPEIDEPQGQVDTETQTSSDFAAATSFVPFQAVWEVDVFDVPTPVADLFFEGALFQQIAERLSDAVSAGLKSVLVTSTKPGEGRSSVAIGMAMAAAAAGIRVALVDADTESPSLADELRLDLQYGWVDVIRRGLPVKEIAVHAVEDGVTLIPLMPPGVRPAATAFEMVQLIDLLTSNFELIILDGPTSLSPGLHQCATRVDSAVIVQDITRTDPSAVSELCSRLQGTGVRGLGVVENFV